VWRWRIWPTRVVVAVDHFSRAVMAVVPLEGPNAGWVVDAMEETFAQHGAAERGVAGGVTLGVLLRSPPPARSAIMAVATMIPANPT
jgi:hypothetical protein